MYAILLIAIPVVIAVAAIVVGWVGVNFYLSEVKETPEPNADIS